MDLGNGRDGRVDKKTEPLVFTVPYSDKEILLLDDPCGNSLGIIYHPRKMDAPIPWKANCSHCMRGQQSEIDIAVKRAVKVLCSRRLIGDVEEYKVPTNSNPCTVWCKRGSSEVGKSELIIKILQSDEAPIDAIWINGKFVTQSKSLLMRSKIVGRSLKLLGSIRPSSKSEMKACLMPLLGIQRKEGIATHRRFPCLKIDWAEVLTNSR
jgi:hypothetical protein